MAELEHALPSEIEKRSMKFIESEMNRRAVFSPQNKRIVKQEKRWQQCCAVICNAILY